MRRMRGGLQGKWVKEWFKRKGGTEWHVWGIGGGFLCCEREGYSLVCEEGPWLCIGGLQHAGRVGRGMRTCLLERGSKGWTGREMSES